MPPLRGQVTALTASMMFELHLQQQGLRFSKGNNTDAVQFSVPFGGYKYTITFRESRGVLVTMNATFDEKIGSSQRAEASIFFAMVNVSIALGCFQLDLRDGEILYWAGVPLEGLDITDSTELLISWYLCIWEAREGPAYTRPP